MHTRLGILLLKDLDDLTEGGGIGDRHGGPMVVKAQAEGPLLCTYGRECHETATRKL